MAEHDPTHPPATSLRRVPLLPLRDTVIFPHTVVPLFVGRAMSLGALGEATGDSGEREIFLAAQRGAKTDEPSVDDLYPVGTLAGIIQVLRLPDGTVKVLVEGKGRAVLRQVVKADGFFEVMVEPLVEPTENAVELVALVREVHSTFETYVRANRKLAPEILASVQTVEDAGQLCDTIAGQLPLRLADKQNLLELLGPFDRLSRLYELLRAELEILSAERRIRARVKKQMDRTQREQVVSEQAQSLGSANNHHAAAPANEKDEWRAELAELDEKANTLKLPAEAATRVKKELKKLKLMAPMSAEAGVVRNYVDWILALPWGIQTEDKLDLTEAERVLDEEHHGLDKVKERILEYLAVEKLVKKQRGPILCLAGPPGVGKTSLARAIARATGRNFVRLALGGVRDEAEIRGHRRTYIGAMPGKLIQSLKKAGSQNPVILLDEVDKMSSDFRGDPASALLEVLDPEQNAAFNDHYLDLDFDLSDVMFITTANYLQGIPVPLQDRLEIIQLPGYTEYEKISIAERHLLPKEKKSNGIGELDVEIAEDTIRAIINLYTREAGVRGLEREIATVCRKIAKEHVTDRTATSFKVTPKRLLRYLGPTRGRPERQELGDEIGLVNGLAVTMHGGDILATEVSVVPGKGKLSLTGKLGDVMQESAQAALSYLRSRGPSLGLDRDFYSRADMHVHLPEGAIPKDGPSAGITICTALVSALLRVPVKRGVAMTGEITLRGRVLAIGGLKEKILAAHRAGMTTVILPKENVKDLRDVPKKVLKSLKLVPVAHMDEVLREALVLADPATFLKEPSSAVDWRMPVAALAGDRRAGDRRDGLVSPSASVAPVPVSISGPSPSAAILVPASAGLTEH